MAGTLRIKIIGDAAEFMRTMEGLGGSLQRMGGQMQTAGRNLAMLTAPLAAVGFGAIKTGMQFDSSFAKIEGLVGVARDEINEMREGVLRLAGQTSRSPLELADALFFVTSAGLRGAEAMDVLEISAKGSAAGLGETKDVANLLTSVINAYGAENITAARAGDILTATIREGKLETDSLAGVMGPLLPLASAMGISFEQLGGQYAAMSRTGAEASSITTSLQAIMTTMLKPTTGASKALESVGLSMGQLRTMAAGPEGLIGVMRLLQSRFEGNDEALAQVIPNVRAFRGVMNLLAQDAGTVDDVLANVANSTGFLDNAFGIASDTAEFKFNRSIANAQVALLRVWETLRGPVSDVLDDLSKHLENAAGWFTSLDPEMRKTVVTVGALAVVLGPVLMLLGLMVSTIGSVVSLFGGLGGAIVGLTGKLWGKHAALMANTTAVGSYKSSLLGVGAAVGVFAAGVVIANKAGEGMAHSYSEASEKIKGMTSATEEQLEQLRTSGRAAIERADALKFMGFWDTEASIKLRTLGQDALDTADRLAVTDDAMDAMGRRAKALGQYWAARLEAGVREEAAKQRIAAELEAQMAAAGQRAGDAIVEGLNSAAVAERMEAAGQYWVARLNAAATEEAARVRIADEIAAQLEAQMPPLLQRAREIGAGIPGQIGKGMQQAANQVFDAAAALRDILENGTSPVGRAKEFIKNGAEYVQLIRQGMNSQKDGARETAVQVVVGAIRAIEDAGLDTTTKRGRRGLKRIGQFYLELLAAGMTEEEARTALVAGGVSDTVVSNLENEHGAKKAGEDTVSAYNAGISDGAGSRGLAVAGALIAVGAGRLGGASGAAAGVRGAAASVLANTRGFHGYGSATVAQYVRGLESQLAAAKRAADAIARVVRGSLRAMSPPDNPLIRDIFKWGRNTIDEYAKGLKAGAASLGAMFPATVGAMVPAAVGVGSSYGPTIIENHYHFHGDFFRSPSEYAELGQRIQQGRSHTERGGRSRQF